MLAFRVPLAGMGLATALALAAPAYADDLRDKAAAEALFREGLRLMASGDLAAACPKLAESERRDPAAGTLLNLGSCYEKMGRVASAWVRFDEAIRASQARGRADWESLARRKAAELAPTLPQIRIVVPAGHDVPQMAVDVDGNAVDAVELGTPIPVDPGAHTLTVTAPGYSATRLFVEATRGVTVDAVVPVLSLAGAPAQPVAAAPTEKRRLWRTVGYSAIIGGSAALVLGVIAGGAALQERSDCTPYPTCETPAGIHANDAAHTWAGVSTASFVVGAVLVVAGVSVVLLTPARRTAASRTWSPVDVARGNSLKFQW